MNIKHILIIITLLLVISSLTASAQEKTDEKLQLSIEPTAVGNSIADNIVNRRFGWRYQKVCSYYGALIFADASNNKVILQQIEDGYAPYLTGKKEPRTEHVDFNVFGIWPLEMYRQTGKKEYLEMGQFLADDEYKNPREDSLTYLTRFWIDDMYMVASLQVQAYKSTKDDKYIDRAATQLVAYIDSLQKPNGLFFHRHDAPFYWGRGNGWAAVAMAELFQVLPAGHKSYDELLESYQAMMAALKKHQGESGMWHQLLDDPESFEEPSCTGMFLYAIATGLNLGLLPEKEYFSVIEKGWNTLATDFVNEKGEVKDVCMWTNAKSREKYYHRRRQITADYHGQAAVLWAATAIIKLNASQH